MVSATTRVLLCNSSLDPLSFFFFNDTATTEIYTLSLHDALPIWLICPGSAGGKNWPAGAYNPDTNVMFFPLQNLCMNAKVTAGSRDPKLVYGLSMPGILAPGTKNVGGVWAISVETGRTLWKYEQRAGVLPL